MGKKQFHDEIIQLIVIISHDLAIINSIENEMGVLLGIQIPPLNVSACDHHSIDLNYLPQSYYNLSLPLALPIDTDFLIDRNMVHSSRKGHHSCVCIDTECLMLIRLSGVTKCRKMNRTICLF